MLLIVEYYNRFKLLDFKFRLSKSVTYYIYIENCRNGNITNCWNITNWFYKTFITVAYYKIQVDHNSRIIVSIMDDIWY